MSFAIVLWLKMVSRHTCAVMTTVPPPRALGRAKLFMLMPHLRIEGDASRTCSMASSFATVHPAESTAQNLERHHNRSISSRWRRYAFLRWHGAAGLANGGDDVKHFAIATRSLYSALRPGRIFSSDLSS